MCLWGCILKITENRAFIFCKKENGLSSCAIIYDVRLCCRLQVYTCYALIVGNYYYTIDTLDHEYQLYKFTSL